MAVPCGLGRLVAVTVANDETAALAAAVADLPTQTRMKEEAIWSTPLLGTDVGSLKFAR